MIANQKHFPDIFLLFFFFFFAVRKMTRAPRAHVVIKTGNPTSRTTRLCSVLRLLSVSAVMSLEDTFASDTGSLSVLNGTRPEQQLHPNFTIWIPGIVIAAVYSIIIVIGLIGNVTLMKTCLLVKSMRTVPNVFLSSLALGDLLLLITCAPVDASRYLVDRWLFGRVGCKMIPFIQLTSVGVSVFTLTGLSADRYT